MFDRTCTKCVNDTEVDYDLKICTQVKHFTNYSAITNYAFLPDQTLPA